MSLSNVQTNTVYGKWFVIAWRFFLMRFVSCHPKRMWLVFNMVCVGHIQWYECFGANLIGLCTLVVNNKPLQCNGVLCTQFDDIQAPIPYISFRPLVFVFVHRLHWSAKILSHEEKYVFLMYFWTLNSNMFPEFLYHPHLSLQVKGLESSLFLPWAPWRIQGFLLPGRWCRVLQWCLVRCGCSWP